MSERQKTYQAALFCGEPMIGSTDYAHEADYDGYCRCPFVADVLGNKGDIKFPAPLSDSDTVITHVAAIDEHGIIVAVRSVEP